jgi:hypothetical protein
MKQEDDCKAQKTVGSLITIYINIYSFIKLGDSSQQFRPKFLK